MVGSVFIHFHAELDSFSPHGSVFMLKIDDKICMIYIVSTGLEAKKVFQKGKELYPVST